MTAFVFVETAGYPASVVPDAPGPAFFPRLVAGLLGLLSLMLAARTLAGSEVLGGREAAGNLRRIGLSLLLVVTFLLLLEQLGVFVLLPFLLGAVMAIMGERRPAVLVSVPLLFDVFVYLVFYRFFSIDLPTVF